MYMRRNILVYDTLVYTHISFLRYVYMCIYFWLGLSQELIRLQLQYLSVTKEVCIAGGGTYLEFGSSADAFRRDQTGEMVRRP